MLDGGAIEGLVNPFTITAVLGLGNQRVISPYQNLFLLSSFLLVAFAVDFVATSSQILVQVLTRGLGFSIPTFVVFMPIWMSWLWLDRIMIFWIVLSLKSLIAAISQSSVSMALIAPNRGIFEKDSASSCRASSSVLAINPLCFVFEVG